MTERKEVLNLEELSELTKQILEDISSYDELGLGDADEAKKRFMAALDKDGVFVIELASDGLDLNRKLALEMTLKEKLALHYTQADELVIFLKGLSPQLVQVIKQASMLAPR